MRYQHGFYRGKKKTRGGEGKNHEIDRETDK